MVAVYNGKSLTGSLLEFVPVTSFSVQLNQLGGLGQFTFGLDSQMSTTGMQNFQIPNRTELYQRQGSLQTSVTSGSVTLNVTHPENYAIGSSIVVFDGVNRNFATVVDVSGSNLAISPALSNNFSVKTTVMKKTYVGMIQQIDSDVKIQSSQKITCIGYFSQIAGLYLGASDFADWEAGYILLNTLLLYTDELDLIIDPSNFVYSPDGLDLTYGTGQAFFASYSSGTSMGSFLTDIIKSSNGNSTGMGSTSNSAYSLWVDEHNTVFFQRIQETTANKTYSVKYSSNDPYNEGLYDNCISFQAHEDSTQIVNQLLAIGGNYSSTAIQPVELVLNDETSQTLYGIRGSSITFPQITDLTTLSAAASGVLNNLAFPTFSYTAIISPISVLPKIWDCFEFIDFPDGSSVICAPQSIVVEWSASQSIGQFKATLQLQQLRPNISNVLSAVSSQSYLATVNTTVGQTSNLADRFVVSGLSGTFTPSTNVFNISAGVFQANVGLTQSNTNFYTDIDTVAPVNSSTQLQLVLNITGSAYVTLSNSNGSTRNFNVSGSYSGTDTGGLRAYSGSTTFTYDYYTETVGGTWTWAVQEATIGSTWSGTNSWYSTVGGSSALQTVSINNIVTELNEFPISESSFTIPSSGTYSIAYLYRNDPDGTIASTCELILFKGSSNSTYSQFQYAPLFRVTCLNGAITGFKDLRNISGVSNAHLVSNPAPSVEPQFAVLPSAFSYVGSGSGSYAAGSGWKLTVGQLGWLSAIRYYALEHGSGSSARHAVGDLVPSASGEYSTFWSGLSGGISYDLYICFISTDGTESAAVLLGTTASNALQLSRANQATFPSGGYTPVASSVAYTGEYNYGTTQDVELTFTLDSLGYTTSPWLAGFMLLTAPYGSGAFSGNAMIPAIASGTYTVLFNNIAIGQEIQLAIQAIDYAGNFGGITLLYTTGTSNMLHSASSSTVLGVLGHDGTLTGTGTGQNLVFNGNLAIYTPPTGVVGQYASAVRVNDTNFLGQALQTPNGWARSFDNSLSADGTMGFIDDPTYGRYMSMYDATSGGNCAFSAVCDAFPISAGQSYSFFADVYFGAPTTAQAQWYFAVKWYATGATDFSHTSSSLLHTDFIVAGSTFNPALSTTVGTLQSPSGSAYCRVVFYHWLTGTSYSAYVLSFRNVRCYEADLDHSMMSLSTQNVVNGNGTFNAGTAIGYLPHTSNSTSVQTVISSAGTYNAAFATGQLPYAAHGTPIQAVISGAGGVNVNPSGGVTGTLPYYNHAGAVTSAVNSSGGVTGTITNIGNVSGGNLPLTNHDSNVSGIVAGTHQIPYGANSTAVTNVISSGSVVNVNNTSGNLAYANQNSAAIASYDTSGNLQGVGASRQIVQGTSGGSYSTNQTFSVTLSNIPAGGVYLVQATFNGSWNNNAMGTLSGTATNGFGSSANVSATNSSSTLLAQMCQFIGYTTTTSGTNSIVITITISYGGSLFTLSNGILFVNATRVA